MCDCVCRDVLYVIDNIIKASFALNDGFRASLNFFTEIAKVSCNGCTAWYFRDASQSLRCLWKNEKKSLWSIGFWTISGIFKKLWTYSDEVFWVDCSCDKEVTLEFCNASRMISIPVGGKKV